MKTDPAISSAWLRAPDAGFNGCLSDRGNEYDTTAQAPTGDADTLFPPDAPCGVAQAQFFLQDQAAADAAIDGITPAGAPRSDIGLAWGWYSLDPGWSGVLAPGSAWPRPYGGVPKVAILIAHGAAGADESTLAALCANMKAQGITLYTAAWDADNNTAAEMASCATDAAHTLATADSAELSAFLTRIPAALSFWHVIPQADFR